MEFQNVVNWGNILTVVVVVVSLFPFVWNISSKVGSYTTAIKSAIKELSITLNNEVEKLKVALQIQTKELSLFQVAAKSDIARLEEMNKSCYVKNLVTVQDKRIGDIERFQIEQKAQLPLQLETIRKNIEDLAVEVKGIRVDIAGRKKSDGE